MAAMEEKSVPVSRAQNGVRAWLWLYRWLRKDAIDDWLGAAWGLGLVSGLAASATRLGTPTNKQLVQMT